MQKGEVINGYTILQDFIVAGGRSKISFASKGDKEYFIKEFLSPKYPVPDSPGSERVKEQKRKACEQFEKRHREINDKIRAKGSYGGNLVFDLEFFKFGPCYYKVTEKVDTDSPTCEEISRYSFEQILLIAKCVCHSLKIMHNLNIVHGDLKPDNILIKKKSSKVYIAKLIDLDDCFFSGNPPIKGNLVGTPEYYSPEQAAYIMDEDGDVDGSTLTLKSDIFTLGIILCEYFTGQKPIIEGEYKTVWDSVNHGIRLKYAKEINPKIKSLIDKMLQKEAKNRPTITEIFDTLKDSKITTSQITTLRGSGLDIANGKTSDMKQKTTLRGKGVGIVKKTR